MAAIVYNADERFSNILEEFKRALRKDLNYHVGNFCRERDVNFNSFRHWLEHKGISIRWLRHEIARELHPERCDEFDVPHGKKTDELYQPIWDEFKQVLAEDRSASLSKFCRSKGIKYSRMLKWMSRNNLTVLDLRLDLGLGTEVTDFTAEAKKRFRVVIEEYKKLLIDYPNLSFEQHCRNNATDYNLIRRWMRHNGISVTMLKESARMRAGMARHARHVNIKFRPNGNSVSNKLHNVMIHLPNGTLLSMEECTVLELCSFVLAYNDTSSPEK